MAISFPASPTNGQIYTPGPPAPDYRYDSALGTWQTLATSDGVNASIFPVAFTFIGKPANNIVLNASLPFAVTVPASLVGSSVYDSVLATSNTVFTVKKLVDATATTLGTVTISPTSHVAATMAGAGGALAAGDCLQIAGPVSQDSTLADICITILCERT
jgi:hypothetical protein